MSKERERGSPYPRRRLESVIGDASKRVREGLSKASEVGHRVDFGRLERPNLPSLDTPSRRSGHSKQSSETHQNMSVKDSKSSKNAPSTGQKHLSKRRKAHFPGGPEVRGSENGPKGHASTFIVAHRAVKVWVEPTNASRHPVFASIKNLSVALV